ncbi:LacI family DNA-binding transcriptional regulator [Corynebacterium breve]|uniref:LacI family DNA-binding transcriptional regulator n=1 Tax=Corynebacterium breve TaxID=3049799 RepID=A0ABY8VC65_9CORY|nr:LacI family DNA-binding transcriptional regulator [Corynebacterium breve]WIM67231.1 LacI family DNA-binding transcriptional regulator [Corynebacterium breve]
MNSGESSSPETPNPSVTIYDIAEVAGVSPSTVSRAFSRPDRVSFKTAEKIRAVATQLGYGTKLETRSTLRETKDLVGLIGADLSNEYYIEILRGAAHAGWVEDVWITASDVQESPQKSLAAIDKLSGQVDGFILVSARLSNSEIQKVARTKPTVVVNRPVPGVPSVLVDNYDGTTNLISHLAEQGATTVSYLSWPEESWTDAVRWRALLDASSGTAPDKTEIITRHMPLPQEKLATMSHMQVSKVTVISPTVKGGRNAFTQWKSAPTDAVICYNDLVARGFISQAQAEGWTAPRDLLIAGYDNNSVATLSTPSLTTVAGPLRSVGRVAAANLIALVRGLKKPMVKPRVLPTRLIVRESTSRTVPVPRKRSS